jgi:antitoxin CptB
MSIDALDSRRKRLLYRSRYRGFLESDILFRRFAESMLARLTAMQLDRYEALLKESDQDLYAWIIGQRPVPARHDHDVMALLRQVGGIDAQRPGQS